MSVWLTAKECISLPGMPGMEHNVRNKLEKYCGGNIALRRRRNGTKAIEYHIDCLPELAREVVQARLARQVLANSSDDLPVEVEGSAGTVASAGSDLLALYRNCPALMDKKLRELTDEQKKIADARMTLVREVLRLMQSSENGGLNMNRKSAVTLIADGSRAGTLPERVQRAAGMANAKKGSTRTGVGISSLQRWVSDYRLAKTPGEKLAIIAPGKIKAKAVESYPWMPDFMRHWRDPNRPTVTMAYGKFEKWWNEQYAGNEIMLSMLPGVDTVRYALNKIPKAERERGRTTGSDFKKYLPYVRRDWSVIPVNGVWVGDGHGMKMEVINPETGKPFKPEITLVIDARTRVVVGWSLAMSESQIAVGDAIRHGISQYGLPLMYYSDNGGGEKNRVFDADITGIFSRLGIEHPTGIPGNPQGRGIIERLNQEIPKRAAMAFGSWVGKSGDRETQRKYRKAVDSAVNAIEKGKELNQVQASAMRKVPTMQELVAEIESQVERHNNRPHSSLPKGEGGKHWSPLAYRNHVIKREEEEIQF